MRKVLGIIVNNYPFGYGESFIHDEVLEHSKVFEKVILFIPMSDSKILQQPPLFQLPGNVQIVPIGNVYGLLQKIGLLFRVGPFKILKLVHSEKKLLGHSLSWAMIKSLLAYLAKDFNFRSKLLKQCDQIDPDKNKWVLYSYWLSEYTYSLMQIKRKFPQLKVCTRMHGWDVYYERHTPPYLPLRKWIIESLDGSFTIANQARSYLMNKLAVSGDKIETFRLGASDFPINPYTKTKNTVNLLSLSFVVPIKHMELIIEGLEKMPDPIKVNWFHIGGGEEYAEEVKQYAHQLLSKKSNITFSFLGTFSKEEIKAFIEKQPIDLFINTSYDEGLPVSMMESLASSIPVIGPSIGGIPELIHHSQNGFLLSSKPTQQEVTDVLTHYAGLTEEEVLALRKNALSVWEKDFNSSANHRRFALKLKEGL